VSTRTTSQSSNEFLDGHSEPVREPHQVEEADVALPALDHPGVVAVDFAEFCQPILAEPLRDACIADASAEGDEFGGNARHTADADAPPFGAPPTDVGTAAPREARPGLPSTMTVRCTDELAPTVRDFKCRLPYLLRAERVAELVAVSPARVYGWAQDQRIATVRFSEGIVRFRAAAVVAFLEVATSADLPTIVGRSDMDAQLSSLPSHTVDVCWVGDHVLVTLLRVPLVAKLLDVSGQTVYDWIKEERFDGIPLGQRTLRVRLETLSEFVVRHEVPVRTEGS